MTTRLPNGAVPTHALEANELEPILSIRVDEVQLGDRLRPVDMVWAEALGQMMVKDHQQTPIEVCREADADHWTLVTGAHRLEGLRLAGESHIRAIEVSADPDERLRREIIENLMRKDLEPIDRATFIARLVALKKAMAGLEPFEDGRSVSIKARWKAEADDTNDTLTVVYGWSDEVAKELGCSTRSVERSMRILRRVPETQIDRLREARHPALKSQAELLKLAKAVDESKKPIADVISEMLADPSLSVNTARRKVEGADKAVPDPIEKHISAFGNSYRRLDAKTRETTFGLLVNSIKSVPELTKMRALINARLEELA